jgi:hypothetical protein
MPPEEFGPLLIEIVYGFTRSSGVQKATRDLFDSYPLDTGDRIKAQLAFQLSAFGVQPIHPIGRIPRKLDKQLVFPGSSVKKAA